jgi:hypothetical protein
MIQDLLENEDADIDVPLEVIASFSRRLRFNRAA